MSRELFTWTAATEMACAALSGIALSALLLGITIPGRAQSPDAASFEVASVKAVLPSGNNCPFKAIVDNSTVDLQCIPTAGLINLAYEARFPSQIEFGSWKNTWVSNDLFFVEAKLPKGATVKQVPEMLRTLLAERFALATHRETRIVAGLALTVGKGGPKFKEAPQKQSERPPSTGIEALVGEEPRMRSVPGALRVEHERMTMAMLTKRLSNFLAQPVIDQTGLKGEYGITMDIPWDPEELAIPAAVQSLGLKLVATKIPHEVVIIDRVERPSDN